MNPGKWKVNLNHDIFMLCKSVETCHPVSLPCKGTNILIFVTCGVSFYFGYDLYNHWYNLYTHGWDVFTCKNILCTCSYIFYSHGCNVRAWNLFWASLAKPVLWQLMILLPCTLPQTSYIPMGAINFYMLEKFLHSLIRSHQFLLC